MFCTKKNENFSEKYGCTTEKCCKKHAEVLPMDRYSRKSARSDSQKQTGEPEEEPEEPEPEDSPPGSQKRDFQQVTKSEPNGISACGLQHPLLLVEIYPYTTGIGGKRQGTCVLEATKIGPNLIGNIATRSAGPKSVGGAAPASAVAGFFFRGMLSHYLIIEVC